MATAPIITVKLEASDEREAIARFIEYTFDKNWVVQDVIDAIRSGLYLEHVRKLISAENSIEIPKEVIEIEKKAIEKFFEIDK